VLSDGSASGGADQESEVVISVVVPAYNEERRLGPSVEAICRYFDGRDPAWELIIVNDGSTDRTGEVMAAAARTDSRIRLLGSATNRGKGHAVRLGVLASCGEQVLICDADLATPIEEVEPLAKALAEGNLVAIGSRAAPMAQIAVSQGRLRESVGRLGNRLIRLLAVPGIADTQCGFKLFDGVAARTVFAQARLDGWGFDFEILYLCGRAGWSIAEVPVRWAHQPDSKVRPVDYLHVLGDLLRVRLLHRRTKASADQFAEFTETGRRD
jgi:glycosyltransferase involved in cell wall biosynthesis